MPHPTYNGQSLPVYSVEPNWQTSVALQTKYNTLVREALDTGEERQGRVPRCLYGIRYRTLPLEGQETGYIRRVLELAQALPVIMPVWTEGCRLLATAALGATTLSVDDTQPTLFTVLQDYVIIWSDYRTWEVLAVSDIASGEITLADATTREWPAGTVVYPILIGYLERNEARQLTDQHGAQSVHFEERFNGLTNQGNVETDIPDLEWEFESACQDTILFRFAVPVDQAYWLQISEDPAGPWGNHIFSDTAGVNELVVNNDYGGTHFFRLVDSEGVVVRNAVNPDAATLEAPTLNDIAGTGMEVAPRALAADEGFVFAYSNRENEMIAPDEVYVVPRHRWHYKTGPGESWDGTGHIPDLSAPVGAVIKWTRDGSDPTEATVMATLDGHANNLAAHRDDFAFILKVRCFKDGCKSPVLVVLVDRQFADLPNFTSGGISNDVGGYCDLPLGSSESGWSCNVNYGGTTQFKDALKTATIAGGSGATAGATLYYLESNDWFSSYLGWPNYGVHWFYYEHQGCTIGRASIFWNPKQPCWTFFYAQTSVSIAETYLGPEVFGATMTTPSGATSPFELALDDYIAIEIPHAPDESPPVELTVLNWVLTRHHDFTIISDPEYTPPDIEPPVVVDPNSAEIGADDFEAYLSGNAETQTLDEGNLWQAAWTIFDWESVFYDDFQTYEDDADIGEGESTLLGGVGWAEDAAWILHEYEENYGGDDFESYEDGTIGATLLSGGERWVEAPPELALWVIFDYSDDGGASSGRDDFESYVDQTLTTGAGATGLDGGKGWNFTEDWSVYDYSVAQNNSSWRYYRLEIQSNNGDANFIGCNELELRETIAGTNHALASNGASATVSSTNDAVTFGAAKLIDGTTANGWVSLSGSVTGQWLQIDLVTPRTVQYCTFGAHPTVNSTAARSINTATLYGSNDGSTFTPLRTIEGQTGWTLNETRQFLI